MNSQETELSHVSSCNNNVDVWLGMVEVPVRMRRTAVRAVAGWKPPTTPESRVSLTMDVLSILESSQTVRL